MRFTHGKGHSDFRSLTNDFDRIKYLAHEVGLSAPKVAKSLKLPVGTVSRWIGAEKPPGRRGPKCYLTDEEDAELVQIVHKRALEMNAVTTMDLIALVSSNFIEFMVNSFLSTFRPSRSPTSAKWTAQLTPRHSPGPRRGARSTRSSTSSTATCWSRKGSKLAT